MSRTSRYKIHVQMQKVRKKKVSMKYKCSITMCVIYSRSSESADSGYKTDSHRFLPVGMGTLLQ
jgi:hypothetical protein